MVMPYIVFKGGTSLSKCHKVIRRFSEDIDITIDTLLSQGQKKKIKQAIMESAEELGMTIENATIQRLLTLLGMRTSTYNFDMRIDKDYNVYLMEVAPRDGGNYIPQAIRYATGIDLVECSVKAAMGEKIEIPEHIQPQGCWAYYAVHSLKDGILKQVVIDPEVERNHLVENHLIVKPGDEIHSFIGANSTLGILVMKFDSLEQMLDMIENADRWIQIEYSMTENYISENKGGVKNNYITFIQFRSALVYGTSG